MWTDVDDMCGFRDARVAVLAVQQVATLMGEGTGYIGGNGSNADWRALTRQRTCVGCDCERRRRSVRRFQGVEQWGPSKGDTGCDLRQTSYSCVVAEESKGPPHKLFCCAASFVRFDANGWSKSSLTLNVTQCRRRKIT